MPDYDARIVDLYDDDNPDGPDHDHYRALADDRDARAILDIGCGTGILTVTFAASHRRVVGVDPSAAMLDFARGRPGAERVTWVAGDSSAAPRELFDLAILSGNVAQHIPDGAWSRTLRDVRERMEAGGALAFESRNPAAREWERWGAEGPTSRETPHGTLVEWMEVDRVDDRSVRFTAYNRFVRAEETVAVTEVLVFRSRAEIERDLQDAGFAIESVAGDWANTPFDGTARIMAFVARAR